MPSWRNIMVRDVVVNNGNNYSVVWGLPTTDGMISELRFINVRYTGRRGFLLYNVSDAVFANVGIQIEKGGPAFTTYNALVITRQPPSQRAKKGSTVKFETAVAGGPGSKTITPEFQWYFNGEPLHDGKRPDGTVVAGSQTAKLELKKVQPGAAGRYSVSARAALDRYDPVAGQLVAGGLRAQANSITAMLVVE